MTKHPKEFELKLPHLIQRMTHNDYPANRKGVDVFFSLDYMGSSEFEFGSIPNSLKIMREWFKEGKLHGPVEIHATKGDQPITAWYLGPEEYRDAVEYFFQKCLADQDGHLEFSLQERPCFWNAYGPETYTHDILGRKMKKPQTNRDRKYVGWWCVDAGYYLGCYSGSRHPATWVIFRNKEDAENWLQGLKSK